MRAYRWDSLACTTDESLKVTFVPNSDRFETSFWFNTPFFSRTISNYDQMCVISNILRLQMTLMHWIYCHWLFYKTIFAPTLWHIVTNSCWTYADTFRMYFILIFSYRLSFFCFFWNYSSYMHYHSSLASSMIAAFFCLRCIHICNKFGILLHAPTSFYIHIFYHF